jgi:signal transduction histidine kinase
MNRNFGRLTLFTLAGMLIGYLLVHPFAMLAYVLGPHHPHLSLNLLLLGSQFYTSFGLNMLAMGLAFALMGGVAGLSLGVWYLQKERLAREHLESQRRQAVLDTLRELMVTLAHHIRNANIVTGGFSKHLLKHITDPEFVRHLRMIHRASQEIDDVIDSLENITNIEHAKYIEGWQTEMIDLKKELEVRLRNKEAGRAAGEGRSINPPPDSSPSC